MTYTDDDDLETERIEYLDPTDPEHPQMWSTARRIWITVMLSWCNLVVTITSSIFGSGQNAMAKELGISLEVSILGTSVFLVVRLSPGISRQRGSE